ncbi:uncharacterized protein LOC113750232 [Coffea eugenioides]|uniref:Uncharacterized protein n=1 Tax=Coffea arabica TaxID=13443 RepID=A0A6P6UKX3_COFAR|nr:uncharacterized protein LOC113711408 [Coffea arabica]XP_027150017.1 uncharacterized protein LOC113750232 [Coffea eugenioides]
MGNGYNYNHHLHQQSFYNKNSFLPLLCRVSIKDVKLREYKDRSCSFSDDPSSPKVSCMGKVKKTNRLIGFSTPYRLTAATATTATTTAKTNTNHQGHFKHKKLRRLFSGKNLITSFPATSSSSNTRYGAGNARSCREIILRRSGSRRSSKINNDDGGIDHVSISELDPPLPVIKKVQQPCEVNLWKRRSGGPALKSLQIEQIHVPRNNHLPLPAQTV